MIALRAVEPDDVDFMLECEADPSSAKWSDYSAPFSRRQLLDYALSYDADPFSAGQLRLIICNAKIPIGILDFYDISQKDSKAFVGICLHPAFRNSKLSKPSLRASLDFARQRLGLNQLAAKISVENPVAVTLFRSVGFSDIGILPSWHRIGPSLHDFHLMSLLL